MLDRRGLLGALATAGAVGRAKSAFAADASSLGRDLTPLGAIRAGNADGSIPAWTGGITAPPAGYAPGRALVDPFAADRTVATISAGNAGQYAAKLSAGTLAKMRAYPDFRINIYPTRRSFSAPQSVYAAVAENARRARLTADGINVEGAQVAVPFPLAANGSEAILNHVLRWRGTAITRTVLSITPTAGGSYTPIRTAEKILFPFAQPGGDPNRGDSYLLSENLAPALLAGDITLSNNYTAPYNQPRKAWTYSAGQRRVRRAPDIAYDTPLGGTDGLVTTDEYDGFNGAIDRYDWKLLGRREVYIPYNCYKLIDPSTSLDGLIRPSHLNPDALRWELHRVYVVEATLKPGAHHVYPRRTFYLDEDSWAVALTDKYDARGALWRTTETYPVDFYATPVTALSGFEFADLTARRYSTITLPARDAPPPDYSARGLTAQDFTPESLRTAGIR